MSDMRSVLLAVALLAAVSEKVLIATGRPRPLERQRWTCVLALLTSAFLVQAGSGYSDIAINNIFNFIDVNSDGASCSE